MSYKFRTLEGGCPRTPPSPGFNCHSIALLNEHPLILPHSLALLDFFAISHLFVPSSAPLPHCLPQDVNCSISSLFVSIPLLPPNVFFSPLPVVFESKILKTAVSRPSRTFILKILFDFLLFFTTTPKHVSFYLLICRPPAFINTFFLWTIIHRFIFSPPPSILCPEYIFLGFFNTSVTFSLPSLCYPTVFSFSLALISDQAVLPFFP